MVVVTIFLILMALILSPLSFYDRMLNWWRKKYDLLRLKSPTYSARLLIKQLSLVSKRVVNGHSQIPELVPYKFYDGLIYKVMDYHRTFGGPIREVLDELRDSLINNYHIEIEVQKVRGSSRAQMITTSIIIWLFAIFALGTLKIPLSFTELWPLLALQILGFIFESFVLNFIEKKKLKPFEELLQSLYLFNLLNFSGSSLKSSLKDSSIYLYLEKLPYKNSYFLQDFQYILDNWKRYGGSLKSEFKLFNEDVRFTFEGQLTQYKQTCSAVQFLTMVLFYFPCFFILMALIMQRISLA